MAFISPLPARSRTSCDRHSEFLRRIVDKGGRVARSSGALRVGFFSIRLCRSIRQRFKPRSPVGAEALASPHKKWSVQLSYSLTMTEMDRRHKRSARVFFVASIPRRRELPGQRDLTQIVRSSPAGASMNFASDNGAGVAPEILAAIAASSRVTAPAYGADDYTARAAASLSDVFETKVEAFLVATGTAANALALSALARPWEAVFCHEEAHVHDDECAAPEFFTGGAKLIGVAGEGGKLTPAAVRETLARFPRGLVKSA